MSASAPILARAPQPVLLYDGSCGLCQRVVGVLLRLDSAGRLKFAPLQSEPAQAYLRAQGLPTADFDSLVFVPDWHRPAAGAYQLRTDGALGAVAALGQPWRSLGFLRAMPRPWRDAAYRRIARGRHRPSGPGARPAPAPPGDEWAERFLAR